MTTATARRPSPLVNRTVLVGAACCLLLAVSAITPPPSTASPIGACPDAPNTLTAPSFTVPAGTTTTFPTTTTIRAAVVNIQGTLTTADASAGQDAPGLCIEAEALTLGSMAVLCTGDGAPGLIAYESDSAQGGPGTNGGRLDVRLTDSLAVPVSLHISPDAILCTGDGGPGGFGVAVPSCEDFFGNTRDTPCRPPSCTDAMQETAWENLCGKPSCQSIMDALGFFRNNPCTLPCASPECVPTCSDAAEAAGVFRDDPCDVPCVKPMCLPSCPEATADLPLLIQVLQPCAPACSHLPAAVSARVEPCQPLTCLGDAGEAAAYGGRGGDAGRFNLMAPASLLVPVGSVHVGTGGRGGDALALTSQHSGGRAYGGDGGLSYATAPGLALLPMLATSAGGDGGNAASHANTCLVPCVPENVNPGCILQATYDACDTYHTPPPRDEKLCSEYLNTLLNEITGAHPYGQPGTDVKAYPVAPGTGSGGWHGEDGAYYSDYSWGASVDAEGKVGTDASYTCTPWEPNTPGGDGGDGSAGGSGTDGAARGGDGTFGLLTGGRGGHATLHAADGGHAGAGGDGGDALAVHDSLCGLETAPAGHGGWGGHGGDAGGGGAAGGTGGASYVQPGPGGNADGTTGKAGEGGPGGDGGDGAAADNCSSGVCAVYIEPPGEWGCGGTAGKGIGIMLYGGAGGINNLTGSQTGLHGFPQTPTPVAGDPNGGQVAESGDGSPRDPPCEATTFNTVDVVDETHRAQGVLWPVLSPNDSPDD